MQDVKDDYFFLSKRLRGRIIGDFRNVTLIMSVVQLSYLLAGRNSWSHEESCTIKEILVDPGRHSFVPFPDALVPAGLNLIPCRTCFDVLREDAN